MESVRNLGIMVLRNKKCLENWKFLLIFSRDFLVRRRYLVEVFVLCVVCDKVAFIIFEIVCCSCGYVFFEFFV